MAELYLHNPHTDDFDLFNSIEELCKEMDRSAWVFKACFGESKTEFLDFIREEMGADKSAQVERIFVDAEKLCRPIARYINTSCVLHPIAEIDKYEKVLGWAIKTKAAAIKQLVKWFSPNVECVPFAGFNKDENESMFWQHCGDMQKGELESVADANYKTGIRAASMHEAGDVRGLALPDGSPIQFVYCPIGRFSMGSPISEVGRREDEKLHSVEITHCFWISKYPVTQGQWSAIMPSNPSKFKGMERPVENVSWWDCCDFIRRLNELQALGIGNNEEVSLPTEMQWEYACRAGTTTPFNIGDELNGNLANCDGNHPYPSFNLGIFSPFRKPSHLKFINPIQMVKTPFLMETSPVGKYDANKWGLFDMHGNVWEWCQDSYGSVFDGNHVLRGGSWRCDAWQCRSACRYWRDARVTSADIGFRLCINHDFE